MKIKGREQILVGYHIVTEHVPNLKHKRHETETSSQLNRESRDDTGDTASLSTP